MKDYIKKCYSNKPKYRNNYCRLSRNCRGWGCKFLTTEIPLVNYMLEPIPLDDIDKPKLFAKVYLEAKDKGVIECPAYRPVFIDEILKNL